MVVVLLCFVLRLIHPPWDAAGVKAGPLEGMERDSTSPCPNPLEAGRGFQRMLSAWHSGLLLSPGCSSMIK